MKPRKPVSVIILAAGQGTRMRSKLVKVLHAVGGRAMVLYPVDLALAITKDPHRIAVVMGHQAERVKEIVSGADVCTVVQTRRLGTGHAVAQAQTVFQGRRGNEWRKQRFLVLSGDTPLLTEATVRDMLALHERQEAAITVLTAHLDRPAGYGRVVRGGQGYVSRIVEDRDATPDERRLTEINAGTYVIEGDFLFPALTELKPTNVQKEFYLTDIVSAAVRQGKAVAAYLADNPVEVMGINTRRELAEAERLVRARIRGRLMAQGVTFLAPETSFVDADVTIGQDTIIHPHTTLEGHTKIGEDCVIRSHTRIVDSVLGQGVAILDGCVIEGSRLDERCTIGPFAHLRPGTIIRRAAKVGNFVELKKADLGVGSKANHLTYLGDATIGTRVNIGAGTITCNYDGAHKHHTVIGDEVFVGSDVSFVAPVRIGKGVVIGAGSVVTEDVPAGALIVGRARQVVKPGWVKSRREKAKGGKH